MFRRLSRQGVGLSARYAKGKTSTRIFVRGLQIQASIGVHPHEHEQTQPVIIDIELDMGDMALPEEDRLHETLDYGLVADRAEAIALQAHVQLVETLAERIADWALSADPRVNRVAVSIAKPQALLKADAAGVEVVKSR
ncbi:dihydroneopterin aldolase [Algimonas porphyrae]